MGKKYPFMIFTLTDESYALYCSLDIPKELDHKRVRFNIGIIIWWYWILGSVLGGLIGTLVPFDFEGIDFVMTALFVCIFVDQWRGEKHHLPALAGLICSVGFLLVVGKDNFILPALIVATGIILASAPNNDKIEETKEEQHE